MKQFQILRYLKKYAIAIALISVTMGILFFVVVSLFFQTYVASAVIEYTNDGAESGLAPDGTEIEVTEIYGSNIISQVIQNLGLDPQKTSIDYIRSYITIEPVITEEQKLTQESQIELGVEYELHPTQYIVSFEANVLAGEEYPRMILNEILDVYSAYYGEKHVNTAGGFNSINDIYQKGYDYIEMMEVIDDSLEQTMERLNSKAELSNEFRAYSTGYSFLDLYREFDFIRNVEVPEITSDILSQKITKDRDVLLAKYRERNNDMDIQNTGSSEEIEKIKEIMDSYVDMMSESGNTDITYEYILDEVYDSYDVDEEGNRQGANKTTEYDQLLYNYVDNRESYENNIIDTAYNQYVIDTFTDAEPASSEELLAETESRIQSLVEKTNGLYDILVETNDEYNAYLGAANIAQLSSPGVVEKIPLILFAAFVVVLFGVIGCVGAVTLGRVGDIIDYYAFTNKLDGLPNRAKCDRYIAEKEKEVLPHQFTCIVLKINNLQSENQRLGRGAGDSMMKLFAETLVSIFRPSDKVFVGYNGSGQYIVFTEELNQGQANAAIDQLHAVISQRCEKENYHVDFSAGVSCSENEKSYHIRKLLSIAMKRLNQSAGTDAAAKEAAFTKEHVEETKNILPLNEHREKKEAAESSKTKQFDLGTDYFEKFERTRKGK